MSSRDRAQMMGGRTGLAGAWDRLRYREVYRQGFGLILVAVTAWFATPGHQRVIWGLAMALLGQAWRTFAAGTIFKNRQLASTGAYAVVRHPLYLGNVLILGGFCLAAGNLWLLGVAVVFFLIWYPAAVRYEDRKLANIFGDEWQAWSQGTGAILPRRIRWRSLLDTRWSALQSLIRNGELYISIYLAACGAWLWLNAHG